MKKNCTLLVLSLLGQQMLFSQGPALTWARSVKSQVTPGNQIINNPNTVVTDATGNIYMTGSFTGTADFDPGAATVNLVSAGNKDIFITKFDASGNFVWAKSIGGSGDDMGLSLAVDGTGNVYVTGVYIGTVDFDPSASVVNLGGSGLHNSFIAKFSSSGSLVWADALTGSDAYSASLALDASSNVYVTGYFQLTVDFDPSASTANLNSAGLFDMFLVKYTSGGVLVWAKSFGGTDYELSNSITVDASDNIYITGYFGSTTIDFDPSAAVANLTKIGNTDMFIAKYDGAGSYIWAKNMGSATGSANARSIKTDASNNVYVSGIISGTVDLDPSASTANLTSASSTDAFFGKYSSSGAYIWAKNVAGSGPDECFSVTVDAASNVYITGYIGGQADFDPSAATVTLYSSGFDIYMAKYDVSGNYVWAKNFGSSANSNNGYAVTIDPSGNLLLAGTFTGTIDFDPTASVTTLTTNPVGVLYNADIFVAKYTTGTVLPLTNNSFTARLDADKVALEWATVGEQPNESFIVERSDDGRQFHTVTQVQGKGDALARNTYIVYDAVPIKDIAYYRLKQVAADGRYVYSKVISIKMYHDMQVDVYPNPVKDLVTIQFNPSLCQTLLLLNAEGKTLIAKQALPNMQLDISKLPVGTYYIQLIGNNGTVSKQVIKN